MVLKKKSVVKTYKVGDIEAFSRFALLPTWMSDNSVVWLEKYKEVCKLKRTYPYGENYFLIYRDSWETLSRSRIS